MTVATYPGGGSAATKSWKYQGRLDVAASGPSLYDFAAREMSPGLGSFTSNDTVLGSATNPRQLNRYVYTAGNPTTFTDPDGHCVPVCLVLVPAAVGFLEAAFDVVVVAAATVFAATAVNEAVKTAQNNAASSAATQTTNDV